MNIEKINKRVFPKEKTNIDLNKQYDIGLVLGCKNYDIMFKRVEEVINLYNSKTIKKIFLSGGIGLFSKNRKRSEASSMKEYLIERNIPEEDIVLEDKSRTTVENMKNTVKNINNESIVVITSLFHSKRSYSILKKLTNNQIYYYGVSDSLCDIDNWFTNKVGKKFVKMEYHLLKKYKKTLDL